MNNDLFWLMAGAILGVFVCAALEVWLHSRPWYHFGRGLSLDAKRKHWIQVALTWAASGRRDSLLRADLHETDLRGVDLGRSADGEKGAILNYANLHCANLLHAIR